MAAMLAATAMQNRSWCPMCGRMGGVVPLGWLFRPIVLVAFVVPMGRLLGRWRAFPDSRRRPSSHYGAEEVQNARFARGDLDQAADPPMLDDDRRLRSPSRHAPAGRSTHRIAR